MVGISITLMKLVGELKKYYDMHKAQDILSYKNLLLKKIQD